MLNDDFDAGTSDVHDPRAPDGLLQIGYWDGPLTPGWPDVTKFVDEQWDETDRDVVLAHLQGGSMVMAWMGYSKCRLCGRDNGNLDLTDGVFVWPEGLAHYIADHSVRLPDEFVQYVDAWEAAYHLALRHSDAGWWRRYSQGPAS